ncbi:MAG: DUF308 domain-containing protein [Eubacteriales bacterium]|nr:DUF308 domain-containing protein [Eubacteriales bacterium]
MEQVREIKKSFCILSVAYIVIGIVLLVWPDISVRTLCYVFGVGMLIFGGAYLIIYFTKDRLLSVMQPDLVIGVVGVSTGVFILLKMEYMLEIIPFALGIVSLLGAVVKVQHALDLRHIRSGHWYVMLLWALILGILGALLVANPFESLEVIVVLIGVALIIDGVGNLISIFWISALIRGLKKMMTSSEHHDVVSVETPDDYEVEEEYGLMNMKGDASDIGESSGTDEE